MNVPATAIELPLAAAALARPGDAAMPARAALAWQQALEQAFDDASRKPTAQWSQPLPPAPTTPLPLPQAATPEPGAASAQAHAQAVEAAPPWPPFAGQASVRGNQVSASLRDRRLGEADAEALRQRLAAQLGRAGFELAELRVNGHPTNERRS